MHALVHLEEEEVYAMGDGQLANVLKQGVKAWNDWRRTHPTLLLELSRVDLCRAILSNAELSRANLSRANLLETDLSGANLSGAHLAGANLINANLSGANLKGAYLIGTKLHGANLSGAMMGRTILADVDLSTVRGLDEVNHLGPSSIGADTLYRSKGALPESFLRGAGLPDSLIVSAAALGAHPGITTPCFIRYSLQDQPFAQQLYADLQQAGIRCWLAPEEGKTEVERQLSYDKALYMDHTRLLVLSHHSVESAWVKQELTMAFARGLQQKGRALLPLWLDEAVTTHPRWASLLHETCPAGDFTRWAHPANYQKAFAELLSDLTATSRGEGR